MSPHNERDSDYSTTSVAPGEFGGGPEDEAMDEAGQALREVEVEAGQPVVDGHEETQLESMSIDELRALATKLDIPDRGQIVEQDKLIEAIRQRL